jgi:tetraprenyl-beta-curcumene synthase
MTSSWTVAAVPRPPAGPLAVARAVPALLREVDLALGPWRRRAAAIPDPELRRQAQASLARKRFHCEGGAVYALAAGAAAPAALRFIVALQTISDYLDNLCDRSPAGGGRDFARLHRAMADAVAGGGPAPGGPCRYYELHPHRDDGGYLQALVAACRTEVASLAPGPRAAFAAEAAVLVRWYCALQVRKHLPRGREQAVRRWAERLRPFAPELHWWEIAAATGSTLGVFALFAAAARGELDPARAARLRAAYFPWLTGLHILLDYWIDRAEDTAGGDMNFTFHYPDAAAAAERLRLFGRRALAATAALPDAAFHRTVVRGLPALYLADPKVERQGLGPLARTILRDGGPVAWWLHWGIRRLRRPGQARADGPWP